MKFAEKLEAMGACREAVKWVGKRGLKTAWRDCKRPDWMLWYAGRKVDRKLLVLAACDCAETALQHVPDGEDRPRIAIETARARVAAGKATINDVRQSSNAAYAANAVATAATSAAASAADAAAYAAASAADEAASSAANAASAAASAANAAANAAMADLIRKRITVEDLT